MPVPRDPVPTSSLEPGPLRAKIDRTLPFDVSATAGTATRPAERRTLRD
jgi:hypothetical protein